MRDAPRQTILTNLRHNEAQCKQMRMQNFYGHIANAMTIYTSGS